jgi:hypothetical protein
MASTMVMRDLGIPVEQAEGVPAKSWAASIKNDPSQLAKAARDSTQLAGAVLSDMTRSRDAEMFQAQNERAAAQKGQELVSEIAAVPRGLDSNLPNADLSGTQEAVIAAADKAGAQVRDLRASAASRETGASSKYAEAAAMAKKQLGSGAVVTNAQPGRTYTGKIAGIINRPPDATAIQVLSDNHAVLHDIKDISEKSNIKTGESVSLTTDGQGYSTAQSRDSGKKREQTQTREGHKR